MEVVAVPARIDVDNAAEVLENLRKATEGSVGMQPALDLAPLQHFDSAALSLLLQLARERGLSAAGASQKSGSAVPLFLLNPPRKLRELAELYGVEEMLFGTSTGLPGQATSS
jgi:ABC-type transporter Mla MlaB component